MLLRIFASLLFAAVVAVSVDVSHAAPAIKSRAPAATGYAARGDVRTFIDELVREHGFSRPALTRWFSDVHFQPKIVAAMQRPIVEPPKWYEYAPQFLTPARIDEGVSFWRTHARALARAEIELVVPP